MARKINWPSTLKLGFEGLIPMMIRKVLSASLAALVLTGCTHNIYFVGRSTGVKGYASVHGNGRGGGDITINLGGKIYEGRWVYAAMGGSVSYGTATAFGTGGSATASGMAIGLPTGGNGNVLASAADGSTLRCNFDYSEWNSSGLGLCQDNKGELYDMQIN